MLNAAKRIPLIKFRKGGPYLESSSAGHPASAAAAAGTGGTQTVGDGCYLIRFKGWSRIAFGVGYAPFHFELERLHNCVLAKADSAINNCSSDHLQTNVLFLLFFVEIGFVGWGDRRMAATRQIPQEANWRCRNRLDQSRRTTGVRRISASSTPLGSWA